jgi:FAD/FMN-containing dehydrogenase/Fe-S oxidoreductase
MNPALVQIERLAPHAHLFQELEADLRSRLKGEVRFDLTTRLLYSTDASLYQVVPVGVVIPRDADDVEATVKAAAQRDVPVLPRGSGTSLGGQTVGAAVVLDFSKYMDQVLELNVEERWVRVQPGVILDELNAFLKPHGLLFPPDVATSNRASVGGMMGNNSSGAHSLLWGRTVDHVLEQRVVLSDGSTAHFAEVAPDEWCRRSGGATLEAQIYREVARVCDENAEEVDRRFPRIMRRVGGYNLDEIVRHRRHNLARIAVGSEGTLVVVTEAKLNLVPSPTRTALLVSHFDDLIAALEVTPRLLAHQPAAVELTDQVILDLTRDNPTLARARTFLQGEPKAIMVTEFYGETEAELAGKLSSLKEELTAAGCGYAHVELLDAARQKDVWSVRKAGLGLLMGMKGDQKPVGFVEDTAVPPEVLADYIGEFRDLLAGFGLTASYYAHASVGCLHVRPLMNLKEPSDRDKMREVSRAVADLVLKYGGAMSAEHGDGLVRSEWQEKMFGQQLYRAFKEVKAAFDPRGIMNPGKIVDAPAMNENLRFGGYEALQVETILDFSRDGGFARSVELCSGVGACRKKTDGTMCPSFRATREEAHSTRGRANMLRMVLSGATGTSDLADPRLHEVLDLCLECKACKSECPSNVDMAKLKYEALAHRNARGGTPLRSRFFAQIDQVSRLGSAFAPLSNWVQSLGPSRWLIERFLGIDHRRSLPRFSRETFDAWFAGRKEGPRAGQRGEVLFLADTFTRFNDPALGRAAVRVLEAFGYRVRVPRLRCCGRPAISKGLLREARDLAEHNVDQLVAYVRRGLPIVGIEPSCVVTLKDEYRDFRLGAAAQEVADNTWQIEDFLASLGDEPLPYRELRREVHLHGHCHQKAVLGTSGPLRALRQVPGFQVTEIPSGCCGMAGSFGYEREHYALSVQIGELSLFPHVRAAPDDALIVAAGTSCRHQIRDITGREALHPIQALDLALSEGEV